MNLIALDKFLKSTLLMAGFELTEINEDLHYGGRRAGASFYRGTDCKLQICWSLRDGGLNYMLAPLDAPDELGFVNESKQWKLMLMLSKVDDDLRTPRPDASLEEVMAWMKSLFEIHFESAHSTLISGMGPH